MITVENLDFCYKRRKKVFSGLNLTFEEGRIYGLLGHNGTGKSTLLRIISGLLLPADGTVTVAGNIPGERKPSFLREVVYVPEEFDMPAVTLDCYVKLTAQFYPDFSMERFEFYVAQFEIDASMKLDSVSMGQRKKAFLAFALACRPRFLLMDEPTNSLDIPSKSKFKSILASYPEPGKTVIVSTHQTADIQNLVDNVVIIDDKGVVMNEQVSVISRKFRFGVVGPKDNTLYSLDGLGGTVGIAENLAGVDTVPDLELLFLAASSRREEFDRIMNS